MKWYHDKNGKPSTMRIVTMIATITGSVAVIGYLVGAFLGVAVDVQVAVVGGGMAGVGEISKAWQAKSGG